MSEIDWSHNIMYLYNMCQSVLILFSTDFGCSIVKDIIIYCNNGLYLFTRFRYVTNCCLNFDPSFGGLKKVDSARIHLGRALGSNNVGLDASIMLFKDEDQEMLNNSIQRRIVDRFDWWINLACHFLIALFVWNLWNRCPNQWVSMESYGRCVVIARYLVTWQGEENLELTSIQTWKGFFPPTCGTPPFSKGLLALWGDVFFLICCFRINKFQ